MLLQVSRAMKTFLPLLVCMILGIGKAALVIRQGRITTHNGQVSVKTIPVVGIATVELGGNPASRPTYYFECITNLGMNDGSGIRWTRMGIPHRFDVVDIPGGNSPGKRMDVGGIDYTDLGVYICSDAASNDAVSVNITGFNPAIMAVKKKVEVVQDHSVALEVYVSGYPIPTGSQITWHYPNHTVIVESIEAGVKFEKGRKKLILSDVQPEQAGLYSCQVEISLAPYLGAKAEIHLQVFDKPTVRAFSADTIKQKADFVYTVPLNYIGTILVCTARGWPIPDTEWQKNGFSLPTRESGIISEYNTVATSNSAVLARLTWTREFRNSDEGEYECIVHQRNTSLKAVSQKIELKAVTVTVHTVGDLPWTMCRSSINERTMYFQIRIVGVECQTWMKSQKERITTQVHHELLSVVEHECSCAVDDRELQLLGVPQCSVQMDNAAVFHGVIQTNSLEKTRLIFCALSFWLEGSAQLQIDGRFQAIDSSCSMEASEILSEECVPIETVTSSGNNVKEILTIAGGVGGFMMTVILLITIVCCTGCYYQRNMNSKCDGGVHNTKGVSQGEGNHTYDHIDFYSRYSTNGPTNTLTGGERATVSVEIGAESLYSYGQLQPSKITSSQDATQSDTDQIYERISNLDLQLESEEAQPYSEPVKANTLAT